MPLLKKEITALACFSDSTYNKSEVYFRQDRVRILSDRDGVVEAEVRGSAAGSPYSVVLEFSRMGNGLDFCDCDCPAFESYNGICKHTVAAILKVQNISIAAAQEKRSNNAAVQMLKKYIQSIADKAAESHAGRVKLEPVLEYGYGSALSLFLRVGEQLMYIVPDFGSVVGIYGISYHYPNTHLLTVTASYLIYLTSNRLSISPRYPRSRSICQP